MKGIYGATLEVLEYKKNNKLATYFKIRQIECKAHKANSRIMKEMKIYLFLQNKQNLKLNFLEKKVIN
jgi:hypothetical protein